MSSNVMSKDGTRIAYEKFGNGPAVVIVGGIAGDRSQQAPLAALLAKDFTVFNFDRRGHGESGMTEPYAVEREIEDIDAIIGGPADRHSSTARPVAPCSRCSRRPVGSRRR